MKTYYNTTQLHGEELKEAVASAEQQDAAILIIYENTDRPYSPSELYKLFRRAGKNWPITSLRRSLTNLTKQGRLVKMDDYAVGLFGKREHKWKKAI